MSDAGMDVLDDAALVASEAQQAVAGYLLLDPHHAKAQLDLLDIQRVGRFLPANDLTRHVYDAACQGKLGYHAVADYLRANNVPVDGLNELIGAAPAGAPYDAIQRIDEMYERRCLLAVSSKVAELARKPSRTIESVVSSAGTMIASVPIQSRNEGIAGDELIDEYEAPQPQSIFPPLNYVDGSQALNYLRYVPMVEASVNVVLAEPGDGKSVLLWNVGRTWAQGGARVVVLSYEMTRQGYLDWEHARYTGMPVDRLVKARLPDKQRSQYPFTAQEQREIDACNKAIKPWMSNIRFFDSEHSVTLEDAVAVIRRLRMRGLVDLVIIDHLHSADVGGKDRFERAANAAVYADKIAHQCLVPVLAAAQLNRDQERKKLKEADQLVNIERFDNDRIGDTKQIERVADSIAFLQQVYRHNDGLIYRHVNRALPRNDLSIMVQITKNRQAGGACTDTVQEIVPGRFAFN